MDKIKHLFQRLLRKEHPVEDNYRYTEAELMARLKFFIGICLSLTLFGIVFVVLYSLIFVTQPLNAISPIDQKFFELIVPIATFLTGTLSGIMLAGNKKEDQEAMLAAQKAANENFAETKKAMLAPPPAEPKASVPVSNFGQMNAAPANFQPQVVMSSNGKPMPVQPPQPEI